MCTNIVCVCLGMPVHECVCVLEHAQAFRQVSMDMCGTDLHIFKCVNIGVVCTYAFMYYLSTEVYTYIYANISVQEHACVSMHRWARGREARACCPFPDTFATNKPTGMTQVYITCLHGTPPALELSLLPVLTFVSARKSLGLSSQHLQKPSYGKARGISQEMKRQQCRKPGHSPYH